MTSLKFRALTHNDHKLFFEALGEHGKDFQNIQQYMAQKGGKNSNRSNHQSSTSSSTSDVHFQGNTNNTNKQNNHQQSAQLDPQERREQEKKDEDKKREQIRNFYNKLYTKLSQLIGKLDDRVEKVIQELYLLINYGEIWKKHGFKFNTKTKKLLEELVHQGYTTIRFKNKNVRLRTPPCKALKKINEIGIDEKVKMVSQRELPKDVIVEFHPATNRDWLRVQSMSQNPRVRAKLSIQKRVFNIIDFLENKWNVSQDKLNRTVDAWLKLPPISNSNQPSDDFQNQQQLNPPNNLINNNNNIPTDHVNSYQKTDGFITTNNNNNSASEQIIPNSEIFFRIRLKPSTQHELKEVNITRVVPDNHLDLSLTAYMKRLSESIAKNGEQTAHTTGTNNNKKDNSLSNNQTNNNLPIADDIAPVVLGVDGSMVSLHNHLELSQGGMSSSSRLPISLTTPDSSILLERSSTYDQPSLAQARKTINLMKNFAGHFEVCENSRTACEDTQDLSLLDRPNFNHNNEHQLQTINNNYNCNDLRSTEANHHLHQNRVSFAIDHSIKPTIMVNDGPLPINSSIPALIDEDAVIETNLSPRCLNSTSVNIEINHQTQSSDCHNSKSIDFNIPKDKTLGDWLHGNRQDGAGDNANDAFSTQSALEDLVDNVDETEGLDENEAIELGSSGDGQPKQKNDSLVQPNNHMIEMKKIAEGWTRQDESLMTIGELYLAFKCPEKIILDYAFEQYTYQACAMNNDIQIDAPLRSTIGKVLTVIPENPSNESLIYKLLTAANLSLTYMEQQKQQESAQQNTNQKFKRRKGSNNQVKAMKQLTGPDIDATNEQVEQALKKLQPTRLSVYRRAR